MANYTVADIQALRERTGAGMMDVKKALDEADGNIENAVDLLRLKGLKGVAKRGDRSASEGLVATNIADVDGGQVGTVIELNSETDFVAKNEKFLALADAVLAAVVASGADNAQDALAADAGGKTIAQLIDEEAGVLGEKVALGRVAQIKAPVVKEYLHRTNKDLPPQVAVLVGSDEAAGDVAREIATHIAALSPSVLSREDVPAEDVDRERGIAEELARGEGKPENIIPKIVEGRLGGFFKEIVLLEQTYTKDDKKTVGQVVKESGGELTGFIRIRVGA